MATSTNKTAAFGVKLIHKSRATIDLLKDSFGDRLISRFGPVNWPSRSCDLTPLDYFLWGYVKSLVYADKPQTLDHLEGNIRRVIADRRPQMLEKVIENWTSRLDYIRTSRGSPMPEILFKINCGGGDRGRVTIYRPFGELHRAKIVLSPVWCSRPTTDVPLAHATMNFVGLDLTTSDRTATAGSDVVQSGRPIFDDFFQHLWPYIGNNTANVFFQMVKRLWLIRIDQ
ncbi:uncharacterized protein TNCV_265151 [Trichonephila clavipes]|nr:uncharacterized protein TNCV_265151 [Trichonephila clavipes]